MVEYLKMLKKWREYVPAIAKAAKDLLGPQTEVYVVGGAAEDRLTITSDVDILIISPKVPRRGRDKIYLSLKIREIAVDRYGLPWDYPIDLHLYSPEEFEKVKERYGKMIKVSAFKGTRAEKTSALGTSL